MSRPYVSASGPRGASRSTRREDMSAIARKMKKLESDFRMGLIGRRYYELRKKVLNKKRKEIK